MTEKTSVAGNAGGTKVDEEVRWPLGYRLQLPQQQAQAPISAPPPRWWSHKFYRGPKNKKVQILYSKTKAESETLAKQFLNEPIIGFDMEWPFDHYKRHRLQDKIGLIQLACEDKIALLHIGLHPGNKVDDLIAPSLRRLIESPDIVKTGVGILNADFARLVKFFSLKPKGAFELSHLHRVVTFGFREPELVTTKLVSLANLTEHHFGLPLFKGDVRTSDWSKALSQKQIDYAAGDAYASFMLYHCMDNKRRKMFPIPPLPLVADKYLPMKMPKTISLQLEPLKEGGAITSAATFFGLKDEKKDKDLKVVGEKVKEKPGASTVNTAKNWKPKAEASREPKEPLDTTSKALFDELCLRRKALAKDEGIPAYKIAWNTTLEDVARQRPVSEEELLKVKGVGKAQQKKYGADWLEVITHFLATNEVSSPKPVNSNPIEGTESVPASASGLRIATPMRHPRRRKIEGDESPGSSHAFGTPHRPLPELHTGLSFTLAETKLVEEDDRVVGQGKSFIDSDESLAFATPLSRPTSQLKRKRRESLGREVSPTPMTNYPEPLTPRSKIFKNKLVALSRLVTNKLKSKPEDAKPIVSEWTLDQVVLTTPRTFEELNNIPGIHSFVQACKDTNTDLLKNIIKFAPARF